jgi:hypothetical protein
MAVIETPAFVRTMHTRKTKIVADGPERLREAKDFAAVRRRLLADVAKRHAVELQGAPLLRRLWIAAKIRREVRRELKNVFPPGALHLAATRR